MTYTQNHPNQNYCECEFTIPVKLNVPITINPTVYINPVPVTKEILPVVIEPDLLLKPGVRAEEPVCYAQLENKGHQLPYQSHEALPSNRSAFG